MKLSTKLAQLKLKKLKERERKPVQAKGRTFTRRPGALVALGLLLAGGATWAVLEFFVWKQLPPALVGKWEVQDGPMQGGTFDFNKNGTLEIQSNQGPPIKAGVAVNGNILLTTTQNPKTLRDETHKSTIQELTQNSLILELERGDILRMSRKK